MKSPSNQLLGVPNPPFFHKLQDRLSDDPRSELIHRILASRPFRSSARLRQFLLYVGECAIRESPEDVTEQQIGIHVFQRPPGYDSSEDSIVRSHARLLRKKLEEYFLEEGADEEVILEIPKGHYLPVFRPVISKSSTPILLDSPDPEEATPKPVAAIPSEQPPTSNPRLWMGISLCVLAIVAAAMFSWRHGQAQAELNTLWHPFVSGPSPLVIYSNALFVEDSDHGVKVSASSDAASPRENYSALLTGTGAVIAIQQLTRLFDEHGASFTLKRSRLVTWDDARSTNLIFIGSRMQNPALTMLPEMSDFSLLESPKAVGFINLHPKPGELRVYARPPDYFTKDYAVIALLPSLQPGKWILIFSGLSTLGTEAAVEYACRPDDVASLLRASGIKNGELRPFEALLETPVMGGVPMHASLITVRRH